MAWGSRQKMATRAIVEGDLNSAAEHLRRDRFHQTITGRRIVRRLTAALIQRAANCSSIGNLIQAWKDLSTATEIAIPQDSDHLSREKNQLVEMTIEQADLLLTQGQVSHASRLLEQLQMRRIRDWRADRISQTAKLIKSAEQSAAEGRWQQSVQQLAAAKNIRPDLKYLDSRRDSYNHLQQQLEALTSQLQKALLGSQWAEVDKCCTQLLAIAPNYQIALDAHRRYVSRMKQCASTTSEKPTAGWTPNRAVTESSTFVLADDTNSDLSNIDGPRSDSIASRQAAQQVRARDGSFLLWVDGVGGYLVCCSPTNIMGQAIPRAGIEIPILGDLRRRHARIDFVNDTYLLTPLGQLSVDGLQTDRPVTLRHGQLIQLDGGVQLRYWEPHPHSRTVRVDLVSRHRTQPWSDGVLLARESIILGPSPRGHIHCPSWRHGLVMFRRGDQWFCRGRGLIEIDGKEYRQEGPIHTNSRISGEDFSLSLEPV